MKEPQDQVTATVIFGYAWDVDLTSKQTLSYTKTYTDTAGPHTIYDVVVNTALPSPSQIETVRIHLTMVANGGLTTHSRLATVATHRPTLSHVSREEYHNRVGPLGVLVSPIDMLDTPHKPGLITKTPEWSLSCFAIIALLGLLLGLLTVVLSRSKRHRSLGEGLAETKC